MSAMPYKRVNVEGERAVVIEEMFDVRRPRLGIPHFTLALVFFPLASPGVRAESPRISTATVRLAADAQAPQTQRVGCGILPVRRGHGAPR